MRRTRFCIIILLVVVIGGRACLAEVETCKDSLCGPRSLLRVCDILGVHTKLEELVRLTDCNDKGCSMLSLRNAAATLGLQSVGMKISAESLSKLRCPAVVHFWGNHFWAVEAADTQQFRIADKAGTGVLVGLEDFRKDYSGFALLVSSDAKLFPADATDGSDLRLQDYSWDFGSVNPSERPQHVFKLENLGNKTLLISSVVPSCSCVAATISSQEIPPGGGGEITVTLDNSGRFGRQHHQLSINSNDPISSVVRLDVSGYVKAGRPRFYPTKVDFGSVMRSTGAVREIYVPTTPEEPLHVMAVTADTDLVTSAVSPSSDPRNPGYLIRLQLKPNAPVGQLSGNVSITTDYPNHSKSQLPLSATVEGNVRVFPDTLFFGIVQDGQSTRRSTAVSSNGSSPLLLRHIRNDLKRWLSVKAKPRSDGKGYDLVATLEGKRPYGCLNGKIVIETDDLDQKLITIPVVAMVEEAL